MKLFAGFLRIWQAQKSRPPEEVGGFIFTVLAVLHPD